MKSYKNFHPESKVWIYQASRFLSNEEEADMLLKAKEFTSGWNAHGFALDADVAIFEHLFLVFFVNKEGEPASGCSIDKQLHLVKELEQTYALSFTNRLLVAYRENSHSSIELYKHTDLIEKISQGLKPKTGLMYQNTIITKQAFENQWLIPVSQSWVSGFLHVTPEIH